MDFAYSPHRETGGTMHLPSPTHHAYRMEGAHFSSLQQLRHSLSRSPSKPSRFQLRSAKADLPGSPISPLALTRAFSPKTHKPASPIAAYSESPFGSQAPQTTKKKFALRRSAPFRSSPRNRGAVSKSPRRALIDSADSGNSSPFVPRTLFGEENTPARKPSAEFWDMGDSKRYDIDDKPIKFEFARSHQANSSAPGANCFASTQPSPLKRRDGIMGFESTISDTPNPKRRSLHGTADFNIFEQTPARTSTEELSRAHDTETTNIFSTPAPNTQSPMRRTTSLRRSASQRSGANSPRAKVAKDSEFAFPGPAASKTRNRMSLDSSFLASSGVPESPFTRSTASQPFMRGGGPAYQRHPLSNALTASSSSSLGDETPMRAPAPPMAAPKKDRFSKSLPIVGPPRPQPPQESVHPGGFATPFAMKMSQLHPGPLVRSTGGLISKKNRDVDSPRAEKYHMPDTPSKRFSYPSVAAESPITIKRGSLFDKFQQHEFGTPSTHTSKPPSESFGKGVSIFGSFGSNHGRRGSFLSIDGGDDDNSHSPLGNHMTDSQSSADDMPPTPTKHHDGAGRRSKESSLRRKTFRQRASVGTDTFAAAENPGIEIPAASMTQSVPVPGASPHTPNESFMPPDPSRLTISGQRRGSLPFNASLPSSSYPPMTPTTPRDHSLWLGNAQPAIPIGLPKNDVDESLSSLFHDVKKLNGELGEFSQVFKVSRPFKHGSSHPSPGSRFWIVKKSKKPFMGPSDREKKMREVRALLALRGNDHVVSIEGHWEHAGHLYIQTEYCEGGDLKTFLNDVGYKSRLDDFRIWKILLELSLGLKFIHESGYIHLDLKPANILIDFEGVLKIADFGMASEWPAPPQIEGEGDRHYLAKEALQQGRFDKPADIFALGLMLAEIAGNCVIPEYGENWQKLRSGEFASVLPSLTWSAESATLTRDVNGDPLPDTTDSSVDTLFMSDAENASLAGVRIQAGINAQEELARAPGFMIDDKDPHAMDQVVAAMLNESPDLRPTAAQVYACFGCQWVERRRRAGATIYEGNFGPSDDVLAYGDHHDTAVDAMDIS